MNKVLDLIKRFIEVIGNAFSLAMLFIMAAVTYEVISRYVFNAPTNWVWLINKQVFGFYVMVAGSYALIKNSHINIEMLYDRFPSAVKLAVRGFTILAAFCFLGSLLWKSTVMGIDAWQSGETAHGVLKLPLYPLKMFIPIGTALFILGCIAVYTRRNG
ncbi:MAG: TRAP transporter small permease subunit [Desulfobacteraceae bacterium]|nr:TRAP transporter small permease subunit [Desulfobacteraceae bacterium]